MDMGIVSAGCPPVVNAWKNGDTEDQLQFSLVKGIDEFVVEYNEEAKVNENLYTGSLMNQMSVCYFF